MHGAGYNLPVGPVPTALGVRSYIIRKTWSIVNTSQFVGTGYRKCYATG